jgi:hypothetical protein
MLTNDLHLRIAADETRHLKIDARTHDVHSFMLDAFLSIYPVPISDQSTAGM